MGIGLDKSTAKGTAGLLDAGLLGKDAALVVGREHTWTLDAAK